MQQGHSSQVDSHLVDKLAAFYGNGRLITAILNHINPVLILKYSRCTCKYFGGAKRIHIHVYNQDLVKLSLCLIN
jgi:hypothetical protein